MPHRAGSRRGPAQPRHRRPPRLHAGHSEQVASALRRARLDGLHDEPRPGEPRTVIDEDIERVIVKALEETPSDARHWSSYSIARATGMSQSTVSRIWRAVRRCGRHGSWVSGASKPAQLLVARAAARGPPPSRRDLPGPLAVKIVAFAARAASGVCDRGASPPSRALRGPRADADLVRCRRRDAAHPIRAGARPQVRHPPLVRTEARIARPRSGGR